MLTKTSEREISDEKLNTIDEVLVHKSRENYISMQEKEGLEEKSSINAGWMFSGYDREPTITEIMVNGISDIFYEQDGVVFRSKKALNLRKIGGCDTADVSHSNRIVAPQSIVDSRLRMAQGEYCLPP